MGKYKYKWLTMGLATLPDIFQEKMSELMCGLEFVHCYISNVLINNKSTFTDHLEKVKVALKTVRKGGIKN